MLNTDFNWREMPVCREGCSLEICHQLRSAMKLPKKMEECLDEIFPNLGISLFLRGSVSRLLAVNGIYDIDFDMYAQFLSEKSDIMNEHGQLVSTEETLKQWLPDDDDDKGLWREFDDSPRFDPNKFLRSLLQAVHDICTNLKREHFFDDDVQLVEDNNCDCQFLGEMPDSIYDPDKMCCRNDGHFMHSMKCHGFTLHTLVKSTPLRYDFMLTLQKNNIDVCWHNTRIVNELKTLRPEGYNKYLEKMITETRSFYRGIASGTNVDAIIAIRNINFGPGRNNYVLRIVPRRHVENDDKDLKIAELSKDQRHLIKLVKIMMKALCRWEAQLGINRPAEHYSALRSIIVENECKALTSMTDSLEVNLLTILSKPYLKRAFGDLIDFDRWQERLRSGQVNPNDIQIPINNVNGNDNKTNGNGDNDPIENDGTNRKEATY